MKVSPQRYTFVLAHDAPYVSGRYFAGSAWATGFMTALEQNSAGMRSRSVRGPLRRRMHRPLCVASINQVERAALSRYGT